MTVFVALLRAVNVGKRSIKMPALKALFESLGLAPAQTLLQSGNVVFDGGKTKRDTLVRRIEDGIETEFGFHSDVVLRDVTEMRDILARNPFPAAARDDPSHLVVMVLNGAPDGGAADRLATILTGPEKAALSGADLFLTYPEGIGRSKLTIQRIEKQLGVIGTGRNWNTVTKLAALAETLAAG